MRINIKIKYILYILLTGVFYLSRNYYTVSPTTHNVITSMLLAACAVVWGTFSVYIIIRIIIDIIDFIKDYRIHNKQLEKYYLWLKENW